MPKTGLTSEEIKLKAIELAEKRIRKFGFEKVHLIDVAKDLGISHAALYQHFPDKSSLFESVTNQWLVSMDLKLENILKLKKSAKDLIVLWFLTLHKLKKEKVSLDPELYKAFDSAVEENKVCVQNHLSNTNRQLSELVSRAMDEGSIKKNSVTKVVEILFLSTLAFHYPKIVAMNLEKNQLKQLKEILNLVLKGLK
ncbi:MAG: TetR family transcriptional regulator [Leptospiraceae bacterium]|nr:TetR family transcriptional regulator [Leptospiraceae bacterium]